MEAPLPISQHMLFRFHKRDIFSSHQSHERRWDHSKSGQLPVRQAYIMVMELNEHDDHFFVNMAVNIGLSLILICKIMLLWRHDNKIT